MLTKSLIDWRSGSQQDTTWILASKLFCPPGLQRSAPGAATAAHTQQAGGNMWLSCFSPIPAAALCPFKCHCLPYTWRVSGRDILPKTKLHPEHQSKGAEKVRFLPSMFSSSDKEKNIGRGWKWIPYLEQIIFIFSAFYLESVISLNA